MLNIIIGMFKGIWAIFKYPVYLILIFIGLFILLVLINIVVELLKGKRFKTGEHHIVKKHNFFRRIFIDFPHQFVLDLFERDPEFFKYQGLIIFEGRQRSWEDCIYD